jgi:hypothetical protein
MKNYQQTPKQVRMQKKKLELAKRAVAHSKPRFNPREAWGPRLKIGGVPVSTLDDKQHVDEHLYRRFWFRF